MSEQYIVQTPENISFDYQIADLGSRFLAVLVDSLIQSILLLVLSYAYAVASVALQFNAEASDYLGWALAVMIIGIFLILFGYFIFWELILNGQTPGKRLVGVRVIKENGYPLAPLDVIVRNLVRVFDFFPFGYGVGVIVMFANSRAKRLGDFAAGTIVVKTDNKIRLSDLRSMPVPPTAAENELPGIENLKAADIQMIESYLKRRSDLKNADTLGEQIAHAIRSRLDAQEIESFAGTKTPTEFLTAVLAAYRRARSRTSN